MGGHSEDESQVLTPYDPDPFLNIRCGVSDEYGQPNRYLVRDDPSEWPKHIPGKTPNNKGTGI